MSFAEPTVTAEAKALPFSRHKQSALLGHMFSDRLFFLSSIGLLTPDHWFDPWVAEIWQESKKFYAHWGRVPTEHEILESTAVARHAELAAIKTAFADARLARQDFGLDVLATEMDAWLHAQILRQAIEQSTRVFTKDFNEAKRFMREGLRQMELTTFKPDQEISLFNAMDFLHTQEQQTQRALTFGLTKMDRTLLPDGNGGSLVEGDTTILLAPTNSGKSTCMVTVAVANARRGVSSIITTHEGRRGDTLEKILRCYLRVNRRELYLLRETEDGRRVLHNASQVLGQMITYIPMHTPGLTIEQVCGTIERRQERRIVQLGEEWRYRLWVDDYPSKLQTDLNSHGSMQDRIRREYVYDYYARFNEEHRLHGLCGLQVNREGNKTNRKGAGKDGRLLNHEDASEAFGPCEAVPNVITLNRNGDAATHNYLTYFLSKSRSSRTEVAVVAKTNYGTCYTHGDDLGAIEYFGDSVKAADEVAILFGQAGRPAQNSFAA